MSNSRIPPLSPAAAIARLHALGIFHDAPPIVDMEGRPAADPQATRAWNRLMARARHHRREFRPMLEAMKPLLPWLVVFRLDLVDGKPTGGLVVMSKEGDYLWMGPSRGGLGIYRRSFQSGDLIDRLAVASEPRRRAA
jgi:hypothetical protein